MRSRTIALLVAALVAVPTAAQAAPQVVDIAGDANGTEDRVGDTRPASYDPGDILSIEASTAYSAASVGEDGIDYEPTGVRIRWTTLGSPATTAIPMAFRFSFDAGSDCFSSIEVFLHGTVPSVDPEDRSVHWWQEGLSCPNTSPYGHAFVEVPWQVSVSGSTLTIDAPYAAMNEAQAAFLADGAELTGLRGLTTYFLSAAEGWAWFPWLDFARHGTDFVIGSDVPTDVPCTRGCPG